MKQVKFEVNEEGDLSFTEVEVETGGGKPNLPAFACACGSRKFVVLHEKHVIVDLDKQEVKALPLIQADTFCARCERYIAPGTRLSKLIDHYLKNYPWKETEFDAEWLDEEEVEE